MLFRRLSTAVAAVVLAALAACAPRAPGDTAPGVALAMPEGAVPIQVQHNAPVAASVTVFLIDAIGTRHLLGSVSPGQTETFVIEEPTAPGPFRLVAEGPLGRGLASRPIHLAIRNGVRWSLNTNTITSVPSEALNPDGAPDTEPDTEPEAAPIPNPEG